MRKKGVREFFSLFLHIYLHTNAYITMRTTLDIPEELIREAMELTGATTKSQLIKEALIARIKSVKRKRLVALKGTIDLTLDMDSLRGRT